MLEGIRIENFRKYDHLEVGGFKRVNFILGDNNIGKTTILEAIFAWACGLNVLPFFNIPLARARYAGIQQPFWLMEEILALVKDRYEMPIIFKLTGIEEKKDIAYEHTITPTEFLTEFDASYKNQQEFVFDGMKKKVGSNINYVNELALQLPMNQVVVATWSVNNNPDAKYEITVPFPHTSQQKPHKNAKYIDIMYHTSMRDVVQIYAALKRERKIEEVALEMRKVYPEIAGFDMIPYPDGSLSPVSIEKTDGTTLPIYAFGDGVQRWFYILGTIAVNKGSIICVDEVDVAFHPNSQALFCGRLVEYAVKNDVQLFLTTHNIEFLDQFLNLDHSQNDQEEVAIVTMKEIDGKVKTRVLDLKDAKYARKDMGLDLR